MSIIISEDFVRSTTSIHKIVTIRADGFDENRVSLVMEKMDNERGGFMCHNYNKKGELIDMSGENFVPIL